MMCFFVMRSTKQQQQHREHFIISWTRCGQNLFLFFASNVLVTLSLLSLLSQFFWHTQNSAIARHGGRRQILDKDRNWKFSTKASISVDRKSLFSFSRILKTLRRAFLIGLNTFKTAVYIVLMHQVWDVIFIYFEFCIMMLSRKWDCFYSVLRVTIKQKLKSTINAR